MENGWIWGHGAYLGPDFSAEYLHSMALDVRASASTSMSQNFGTTHPNDPGELDAAVAHIIKENRYEPASDALAFTEAQADSFRMQQGKWRDYFFAPAHNSGLAAGLIQSPDELRKLTAFFAWAAWASAARRPGKVDSYTNNFPYDPLAGNLPTSDAVFWSAMSLLMLLGGIAAILFAFGRFDFLLWHSDAQRRPAMLPHQATSSQRATLKYFVLVSLLFLAQVLVGGGVAHFRADAASFYGIDISRIFPSQLLRTWHLQLAILWIATAFLAGGLFVAPRSAEMTQHISHWASTSCLLRLSSLLRAACWASGSESDKCLPVLGVVWQPRMGISRSRQGLADWAGRRTGDLGGAAFSRGAAGV